MGQPSRDYLLAYGEYIAIVRRTRGTETSKYLEEKKANSDSLSSGERTGISLNREMKVSRGRGVGDMGLKRLNERHGMVGHRR